jgi:hypothetical protein
MSSSPSAPQAPQADPPARAGVESRFLRELRAAVGAHYRPQIDLCCQVAVLAAMGFKRSEIQARTGASPAALRRAIDVLRASTPTAFEIA